MSIQESDRSVVVRDGRAVHMAKGSTGRQRVQSTHAGEKKVPRRSVSSSLNALREKASREPDHRFGGLYTMINMVMLRESFHLLRRRAASGVDGQSVADYESDLEVNLAGLLERLKSKSYRAKLVRRRYIPKADGKLRPLGIPAVEDKIVQMSARRILESIYEADFMDTSWGYRKGKGAREASGVLREALLSKKVNWVVEADIKGFFTQMDHRKLLKMLRNRIDDEAFVRLIGKWLSAALQAMKHWVRKSRNLPLSKITPILRSKLVGHYNYYGVVGNAKSLGRYRHWCQRLLYKWLNRRSQKRSYDWDGFCQMWNTMGMPEPKLNVKPYQLILEPLKVYY